MSRRDFVRLGLATLIATGAGKLRPAFTRTLATRQGPGSLPHRTLASEPKATASAADFTLRIAPMIVELAPHVVISTIGYNNKIPGPLLRVREGQRVGIEVVNARMFRNMCIGTVCSFLRTLMEWRKKVRLRYRRMGAGAINS